MLSSDVLGALYVIVAGITFIGATATLKHVTETLPLPVAIFFRSVFASVPFIPILLISRGRFLQTKRLWGHVWRAVLGLLSYYGFAFSVANLPLGDAISVSYTTPLWSTLLAILWLGDRPGPVRLIALAAGFSGVLLIAKPGSLFLSGASAHWAMLIGLGGAFFTALAILSVKRLSSSEPPERIALYFLILGGLIALPPAVLVWQTPQASDWVWLLAFGGLTAASQVALSKGYALATVSRVAPMDFVRLPIALTVGIVLFSEIPDALSLAGSLVIALASLVIVLSPGGAKKTPLPGQAGR